MSAEVSDVNDGVLTLRVSGLLTDKDMLGAQQQMAEEILRENKIRILALVENFSGWDPDSTWDDFSFQERFDPHIEKMAIVGEKKWQDLALLFTAKGLRGFPIEYFVPADMAGARAWLETDA